MKRIFGNNLYNTLSTIVVIIVEICELPGKKLLSYSTKIITIQYNNKYRP